MRNTNNKYVFQSFAKFNDTSSVVDNKELC